MGKEDVPLQIDLFTGDLVDNRTNGQKQRDRERQRPQQTELFSQREVAQFGVTARPQMSLSPHTKLVLMSEDPRTEEQIEADRQREAEALTYQLFSETPILPTMPEHTNGAGESTHQTPQRPHTRPAIIGYRAAARRRSVALRRRG